MSGRGIAVFTALAIVSVPAQAQDFGMGWFNNSAQIMDSYVAQSAMASVANPRANPRAKQTPPKTTTPKSSPRTAPKQAPASLTFASNAKISQQVRNQFRDSLVRTNPTRTSQIDAALKQDWLRGYARDIARPNGLDPQNLADSHAAYFIASWALVNGVTTLSPQSIAAVRNKVRADLSADPRVTSLSASEKQQLGENLNYNTVLVMAQRTRIHETGDKTLAAAATRHYGAQFKKLGIDLSQLKLTEGGFAAR